MHCNKVCRLFSSTSKDCTVPFSHKRDSMFYVRNIKSNPPPSLKSIYRKYLKQSLKFYKSANQYLGQYPFRLLQIKKSLLQQQHQNLLQINQLIDQIKSLNQTSIPQTQTQLSLQKNPKQKKINALFSKLKKQTKPQLLQSQEIKLNLQKQSLQRVLTQKILFEFQCLYHISNILQNSMDLQKQKDLRTKQQSKLVHLSFNVSEFFTQNLSIRQGYQSLVLLEFLEDDMEYEVLSSKDKHFVREVITKVCGPKKLNHSRYRSAIDYLKDMNAVANELKFDRTLITKNAQQTKKNENLEKEGQIHQDENQQNEDDSQDNKYTENQWVVIKKQQRNQFVRKILSQKQQQNEPVLKKGKISKKLKKSLIFEILLKIGKTQNIYQPNPKIQQQIYQIVKRLFKITDSQTLSSEQTNDSRQSTKTKMKYPLLQEFIMENQFIDEFINEKKIIIV